MKAVLAILAVVLAYVTCAYVPVNCPDKPDEGVDYALVAHPCNCSSYFICYHGYPTAMPCPPKLHWNSEKKYCDYPGLAKCVRDPLCDQK
ncbi:uncharacterized protein LOC143186041 [Calliopsis andreniformis]|uniref:uncharacterized protein LOC143186041 n=1 Tax=Calliopsis andreniformis TaxID=337506 RepID=UPI003FCD9771